MSMSNGGDLLVRTLKKAGVDTLFALHGAHVDSIFQAATDHGLRIIDVRHEAAAGHAAEGYARSARRLGVAVVTSGAGVTNIVSSMANAFIDRTPVLYIGGAPSLKEAETNTLQGAVDQVALTRPITKWSHQINRTEDVPRLVAQAIRCAMAAPMGPVFLNLPIDIGIVPLDDSGITIPDNLVVDSPRHPAPELVERALDLLIQAERPVLLVGGDAHYANAGAALTRFIEATGIPVFSDFAAHGLLPASHPLYGGTFHKLAYVGDARPDAVLALGTRFGLFTLGDAKGLIPLDAKLVHVEVDAVEIGRLRRADVAILADPRAALEALSVGVAARPWTPRQSWAGTVARARSARRELLVRSATGHQGPIHPYLAVAAIADAANIAGAAVVADGAEAYHWLNESISQAKPGTYLTHGYLGCMGIGLGLAVGAQIADPSHPVLLMSGDGAIGFNIIEFDTLVRHGLPVVVVVMNNQSWGASERFQDVFPGARHKVGTQLRGPVQYDQVARGFGCGGVRIELIEDLAPAIAAAFASGRPTCIDLRIDYAVPAPEMGLMMSQA